MAFCFSNDDQNKIRDAMRQSQSIPETAFWGTLAGHLHEWNWFETVFQNDGQGFSNFKQYETSACKGNRDTTDINGAISIVPFNESTGVNISQIERRWFDNTK
jgi:hypothetical protein